ncbi:MAG TPA: diguanylate cyclase [Pyrinomonadaceae bacterium]|jgi:diguanylate cyclase (GGDEF)-like protein
MSGENYHKEMSLREWSLMLRDIYYPVQNYGRSSFEIFTHLIKVFGAGSHYLFRSHDAKGSREYLAKVFAWYCALANRLDLNLEDILWQKYPGVCPRCLAGVCECSEPPAPINPEKLTMMALERINQRPTTLREWQVMFARIYKGPSGKTVVPPTRERLALVFARIAEELGEVAEALGQDQTIDSDAYLILKNEMADLGAWVFALANNLQYVDTTAHGVSLADIAWQLYPAKCHRCGDAKCICIRGAYALELAEKGAMAPSHWDERTGLANDKAFRQYLSYANNMFQEGNYEWSLIFLDLDDFGAVNKTYGHQAGDEVLRLAAQRIQSAAGRNGIAFRRGGEEFVVVIRTYHDAALVAAEKLRRYLANDPIISDVLTDMPSISITASLGVATLLNDAKTPNQLETIAEARSREAKQAGKNRVVPEPSQELLRSYGLL